MTRGTRVTEIMSVTETPTDEGSELDELPRFGLSYLFDNEARPNEVTLFPETAEADLVTQWLTVSVDDAIPLDKVR